MVGWALTNAAPRRTSLLKRGEVREALVGLAPAEVARRALRAVATAATDVESLAHTSAGLLTLASYLPEREAQRIVDAVGDRVLSQRERWNRKLRRADPDLPRASVSSGWFALFAETLSLSLELGSRAAASPLVRALRAAGEKEAATRLSGWLDTARRFG